MAAIVVIFLPVGTTGGVEWRALGESRLRQRRWHMTVMWSFVGLAGDNANRIFHEKLVLVECLLYEDLPSDMVDLFLDSFIVKAIDPSLTIPLVHLHNIC